MQGREVAPSEWELVTSVVQSSYSECYNFLMKHKLSELPLKVCILSLRGFESRQTAILTGANLQSIKQDGPEKHESFHILILKCFIMHLVFFPFLSVNHIIVFTRDAETYGLVAFDGRNVITEYAECDSFSIQFPSGVINSKA